MTRLLLAALLLAPAALPAQRPARGRHVRHPGPRDEDELGEVERGPPVPYLTPSALPVPTFTVGAVPFPGSAPVATVRRARWPWLALVPLGAAAVAFGRDRSGPAPVVVVAPPAVVPEPATWLLFAAGALVVWGCARTGRKE